MADEIPIRGHDDRQEYVTRDEAAMILGVDVRTVDRYAVAGKLTRYRRIGSHGRQVRFKRSAVLGMAQMSVVEIHPGT